MVPYWSCLLWYSSHCHIPSALELLESGIERVLSFAVAIHSQDSHYNTGRGSLIFLAGIVSPSVIRWPFYFAMHSGINMRALTLLEFSFAVYTYSFLASTYDFWQSSGWWCFEFIPVRWIWAMASSFFAYLMVGSKQEMNFYICRKRCIAPHENISVNVKRAFRSVKDTVNPQRLDETLWMDYFCFVFLLTTWGFH